ncbi:MAG: DUF4058 family protein [Roseiflexaceae bacterium]|nr:DUF4058 family protein [Roseiflexaceae bacterium]
MELPFPGMDPYLEQPSMWPDVHSSLIGAIRDQLQSRIAPTYRAVITPYSAFESLEIAPVRRVVPDIGIYERDVFEPGGGVAVAIEPAPLTMPALMEVPTEYARIEIRTVGDQVLITAIELLSPVNKRPGAEGAEAYDKKRQELFRSAVHLIDIDLLRAGRRPQMARELPDAPYFIFLSRMQRRPQLEVWPLSLRAPIKPIPVPLRHPDPDVPLDLGLAIRDAYSRARYDLEIDYRAPPPAPPLAPDDAAWLDAHLRERGLRN